jgi:hypothetical protein
MLRLEGSRSSRLAFSSSNAASLARLVLMAVVRQGRKHQRGARALLKRGGAGGERGRWHILSE